MNTKQSEKFAVIATGGKQYVVSPDDVIRVEKIDSGDSKEVTFSEVLLVADEQNVMIGKPTVDGASVVGEVLNQGRTKKVRGVKFKAKKRQKTVFGHRQQYTEVQIKHITV
jgi:large subunit ribosomal protein L21